MKKIAKEKEMGKRKALNELNKKARNKSFSKILLDVLKNPKNECDHFKSDLDLIPCSLIFLKVQNALGNSINIVFAI